jgi:hypothetical protein
MAIFHQLLSSLQQAGNPDQNHGTDKRNDDGANHATAR